MSNRLTTVFAIPWIAAVLWIATACQSTGGGTSESESAEAIDAARGLMDRMATAIRSRDAELMISVYPDSGTAVFIANTNVYSSSDAIAQNYRGWNESPMREVAFEWANVQYEVLGPDAVVGIARFTFAPVDGAGAAPDTLHGVWTGVFRRWGGRWALMLEHEGF